MNSLIYLGDDGGHFRLTVKRFSSIGNKLRCCSLSEWELEKLEQLIHDPSLGEVTFKFFDGVEVDVLHTGYSHKKYERGPFVRMHTKKDNCVLSCENPEAIRYITDYVGKWPVRDRLLIIDGLIPPFILDMFSDQNHMPKRSFIDEGTGYPRLCQALSFSSFEGEDLMPMLMKLAA